MKLKCSVHRGTDDFQSSLAAESKHTVSHRLGGCYIASARARLTGRQRTYAGPSSSPGDCSWPETGISSPVAQVAPAVRLALSVRISAAGLEAPRDLSVRILDVPDMFGCPGGIRMSRAK